MIAAALATSRACVLLGSARLLRGKISVKRQHRVLGSLARWPLGRSQKIPRILSAHRRAARIIPNNCLDRSMALCADLKSAGTSCEMRFGVQTAPFRAHAWIVIDGRVIGESAQYVADFAAFDGDPALFWT